MDEQEAVREQRRVSMGRLRSSQTEEERRASNETAMLAMRDRRAFNRLSTNVQEEMLRAVI